MRATWMWGPCPPFTLEVEHNQHRPFTSRQLDVLEQAAARGFLFDPAPDPAEFRCCETLSLSVSPPHRRGTRSPHVTYYFRGGDASVWRNFNSDSALSGAGPEEEEAWASSDCWGDRWEHARSIHPDPESVPHWHQAFPPA